MNKMLILKIVYFLSLFFVCFIKNIRLIIVWLTHKSLRDTLNMVDVSTIFVEEERFYGCN